MTVAGHNAVSYTFDNANRLTQVSQSGTGTVIIGYDKANRRTLLTLPNNVAQAYVYDNGGQGDSPLTSLTYWYGNTTLGTLTYGYDADGRRSTVGESLAAVRIPGALSGNAYNADNEATNFNGHTLTYDADGQTLTDTSNTYTWDVRRHLSRSHLTGINYGSDFVYDALGRRVQVTNEALGTTTQYLYDGLNPIQLTTGSSATNVLTGLNLDEYFSFANATGAASFLTDALGSTIALTDSTGAVFASYSYEPYGRQKNRHGGRRYRKKSAQTGFRLTISMIFWIDSHAAALAADVGQEFGCEPPFDLQHSEIGRGIACNATAPLTRRAICCANPAAASPGLRLRIGFAAAGEARKYAVGFFCPLAHNQLWERVRVLVHLEHQQHVIGLNWRERCP